MTVTIMMMIMMKKTGYQVIQYVKLLSLLIFNLIFRYQIFALYIFVWKMCVYNFRTKTHFWYNLFFFYFKIKNSNPDQFLIILFPILWWDILLRYFDLKSRWLVYFFFVFFHVLNNTTNVAIWSSYKMSILFFIHLNKNKNSGFTTYDIDVEVDWFQAVIFFQRYIEFYSFHISSSCVCVCVM